MAGKLEVSFNSPQCGWMSIGFDDGTQEFHTTTSYTPHTTALSDLLLGLTSLIEQRSEEDEFTILWSRNPEAFDLLFRREGQTVKFQLVEYPTSGRANSQAEVRFVYEGSVATFCRSFYRTFEQLNADRDTDEFESNWNQPFPQAEFETFKSKMHPLVEK